MQSLASNHGDLYQFPLIFGGRSFSALVHQLSVLCSQAPRRSSVFRPEQISTSACLPLVGCSPSLSTAPSWSGRWPSLPCAASSLPVCFHLCVDFCRESSWAPGAELSSAKRSSTGGADLRSPKRPGLQREWMVAAAWMVVAAAVLVVRAWCRRVFFLFYFLKKKSLPSVF